MKQEQLTQAPQEQAPEIPEEQEELSAESVNELAESKETALDEIKERSSQETTTLENTFAQSAQGLGATPEEIAPVTEQIGQLEVQKEQIVEVARQQIENVAHTETPQEAHEAPTEKENLAEKPYSKEDIIKEFSVEHLESLSTEDYIKLLQRFPGEMMTHVTRHGIRDHADLGNHKAGLGEYHDSFQTILQKKELRSALGIYLQKFSEEDAVSKFLKLKECDSRNAALGRISGRFNTGLIGDPRAFADSSAVHLAAESVADKTYGGESGNEIFFAFPSVMVASQYEFSGNLSASGTNNDHYVWPDIDKGLSVDSGIAFIPEDAMVTLEKGSKYELDQDNRTKPIEGIQEVLNARFGEKPGFVQAFIQKSYKYNDLPENEKNEAIYKILDEFGIRDDKTKEILSDSDLVEKLSKIWGMENEKDEYEKILTEHFQGKGLSPYKLAENPVSSKEYWEDYFQKNPESRPKHIVYYSGGNPTKAMNEWRQQNGITIKDGRPDMGFPENEVSREVKNKDETQRRFVLIARKEVDKYFPTTAENPSYKYDWSK